MSFTTANATINQCIAMLEPTMSPTGKSFAITRRHILGRSAN